MRIAVAAALVAAASVTTAACTGKSPYTPGTPLGTFHVVAHVTKNDCGDAEAPPDPWEFDVQLALSDDARSLYWLQGSTVPISAPLDPLSPDAAGARVHARFTTSTTASVHDAIPRASLGACAMTRDDLVDAIFGGTPILRFDGTLSYRFSPTDGSDCTDQLASAGGPYATLPCALELSISAARSVAPPAAADAGLDAPL